MNRPPLLAPFSDSVRRASALIHGVDGAVLRLKDGHGREVSIGRHPSADVDPCRWRRFVAADHHHPPAVAETVVSQINGRLEDRGAVFADRRDVRARWFVSSLCPGSVAWALRGVDLEGKFDEDNITATLRPDLELGLTIVGIKIDGPFSPGCIDHFGQGALAACLVGELKASLMTAESQS